MRSRVSLDEYEVIKCSVNKLPVASIQLPAPSSQLSALSSQLSATRRHNRFGSCSLTTGYWALATGYCRSSPQHSCSRHQQNRAQDSAQQECGTARAQMRAEHSAGNRADQQGTDQMGVDVARPPVQQAGDAGQNYGMGNVGANHDFGHEGIEQKKHHHNDAARPDRSDADQESADQADDTHAGKRFHGGLALGETFFNPSLEQKQRGNQYQQQSHGGLDEVVDAVAIDVAQVLQKSHAEVRAGNAADRHRQHDLSAHCTLPQVHDAGGNLGEKVE